MAETLFGVGSKVTATVHVRFDGVDHVILFSRVDSIEFDSELGETFDVGKLPRSMAEQGKSYLRLLGQLESVSDKRAVPNACDHASEQR